MWKVQLFKLNFDGNDIKIKHMCYILEAKQKDLESLN